MADESHTFGSTRARLEEIVAQVRKKDTSLEKSLDLLEEGVRLANACTELIDHQDWGVAPPKPTAEQGGPAPESAQGGGQAEPAVPSEMLAAVQGGESAGSADQAIVDGGSADAVLRSASGEGDGGQPDAGTAFVDPAGDWDSQAKADLESDGSEAAQ